MMTRTSRLFVQLKMARSISSSISRLMALRFSGRFIVSVAIPRSSEQRMVFVSILLDCILITGGQFTDINLKSPQQLHGFPRRQSPAALDRESLPQRVRQ